MQTTKLDAHAFGAHAGFARRTLAWCIDAAIVLPFALGLTYFIERAVPWVQTLNALQDEVNSRAMLAAIDGTDFVSFVMSLRNDPVIESGAHALIAQSLHISVVFALAFAALSACWHIPGEAGVARGSMGKKLLGLQVIDGRTGKGLTIQQALLRHLAGTASWLSLNLGHLMAALPPDYTALHDRMTGTRVITRAPSSRN